MKSGRRFTTSGISELRSPNLRVGRSGKEPLLSSGPAKKLGDHLDASNWSAWICEDAHGVECIWIAFILRGLIWRMEKFSNETSSKTSCKTLFQLLRFGESATPCNSHAFRRTVSFVSLSNRMLYRRSFRRDKWRIIARWVMASGSVNHRADQISVVCKLLFFNEIGDPSGLRSSEITRCETLCLTQQDRHSVTDRQKSRSSVRDLLRRFFWPAEILAEIQFGQLHNQLQAFTKGIWRI